MNKDNTKHILWNENFPLSCKYDPEWVLENEMGPNALWLTEWLCGQMDLKPPMRVLDMGCGRTLSSIFLAKEFGVRVWANDLWISANDNWKRICEAGVEDSVFPIHAEARSLPYAEGFFDAIVSVDSYQYYGTDDLYLNYFVKFVKPGGQTGIVVPGLMRDFEGEVPEKLVAKLTDGGWLCDPGDWLSFHTADWWQRLWIQTNLVEIKIADTLPEGWQDWLRFIKAKASAGGYRGEDEIPTLEADRGRYLGFVRMIARRKIEG